LEALGHPGGVISRDAAAYDPHINVVIHEFAHQLDMLNGAADGMAPLHPGMDRAAWINAFNEAYEGFCDALERGKDAWLDLYAAEQPAETKRRYPAAHDQLKLFYKQDPR